MSAAATTGDDQRRVAQVDYKGPATTAAYTTANTIATRTADGDLQDLACGQAEVAAYLGP
jgi:hypothetical protein